MQHCPHGENELYSSSLIALLKGKIILAHVLFTVGPIYNNNNIMRKGELYHAAAIQAFLNCAQISH
jgi:hypothetical protein